MADGPRRLLAIGAAMVFAFGMLTVTGTVTWPDSFGCALLGRYAFGPLCIGGNALGGVALVSGLIALAVWPWPSSRLEHGHHAAPDEQRAAGDHGDVEGRLEQRRQDEAGDRARDVL